jgi:PTH1 family peptidyl-tRNA hydrolase
MTLIVGLGNPGKSYEQNRHNIGFMVIDYLVGELGASSISKASFQGDLFKAGDTYLLKPTTYMNLSGKSVLAVKQFYKIDNVIVIHDELDLPFGALRYKKGGGNGGHNGLKSIDGLIGNDYIRVRMGIGKPEHKSMVADYVLHDFNDDESPKLDDWIKQAATATLLLCEKPLDEVASKHSQKQL